MLMIDEIRNAINDFWANEARPPERIYLGVNHKNAVMQHLISNYFIKADNQSFNDMKSGTFEGVTVYFVSDPDHLHVC